MATVRSIIAIDNDTFIDNSAKRDGPESLMFAHCFLHTVASRNITMHHMNVTVNISWYSHTIYGCNRRSCELRVKATVSQRWLASWKEWTHHRWECLMLRSEMKDSIHIATNRAGDNKVSFVLSIKPSALHSSGYAIATANQMWTNRIQKPSTWKDIIHVN